eukprot:7721697-Lingulodinium_polyedra.AAC.1
MRSGVGHRGVAFAAWVAGFVHRGVAFAAWVASPFLPGVDPGFFLRVVGARAFGFGVGLSPLG